MIETKAMLTIVAWDDAEADRVYAAINRALAENDANKAWPRTPIVGIHEIQRTHREPTDFEREAAR